MLSNIQDTVAEIATVVEDVQSRDISMRFILP